MQSHLAILSGNSNLPLVHRVCSHLDVPQVSALVGRFSDGEVRVEIQENVRGKDVYAIQSICPPVNENLMELLVLVDALKRASARRITVVIPYYGYGRKDKKHRPRVPITAKVVADLLTEAGAQHVIALDLHAAQIEGFFRIPVDHLSALPVLMEELKNNISGKEVIVAPDAGGVQRCRAIADQLSLGLAIMDHRRGKDMPRPVIVGDVQGRPVIIIDDLVDTGRTLRRTVDAVMDAGASSAEAYCVHAVLSGNAKELLAESVLRDLIVTDTIPAVAGAVSPLRIKTLSIAPVLAEVIQRVHREESVSTLFV